VKIKLDPASDPNGDNKRALRARTRRRAEGSYVKRGGNSIPGLPPEFSPRISRAALLLNAKKRFRTFCARITQNVFCWSIVIRNPTCAE